MKKLPCPRCGKLKRLSVKQMSRMLNPREWEVGWEVQCNNCCMSSGIAQTKEKAVEVWNSLPRRLRWTTETPTEEGWYFRRANSIVNVVLLGGSPEGLCVLDGGKLCPINWFSHGGRAVEWAGPIPEPQEQP